MTTSAQPICVSPTEGQGDGTPAIKQALPLSPSAAAAAEAPAKDTSVRNLAGTKIVELMDPISPAKHTSIVDDQLPSLLSFVTDGLPPFQQSKYVNEAEKCLHQYLKCYQNVMTWDSYCRVGLSSASYMYPGVISNERLKAIAINYALLFLLDDIFFDIRSEFLRDQYGVSSSVFESPEKIQEYLDHLMAIFSQQEQPRTPTPAIETLMCESGREILELSNPDWFGNFVTSYIEFFHTTTATHVDIVKGNNLWSQDLESYTIMRVGNIAGYFIQLLLEFAKDTYIPSSLKVSPYFENLTMATSIHLGFVNDVFSYHKESSFEQNPRNLITVLMECEGKPFVQTVHMAIDLVNTYACTIVDLESQAWNSTLQNHIEDVKALIAGNIYYSFMDTRYRHPDSFFPELREMTRSWKLLPDVKGTGL